MGYCVWVEAGRGRVVRMHVQTPVWAALAVAAGLWAGAAQAQPVPRSGPAPSGGSSSSSSSATTPEAALACVAARYQGEALAVQWLGRERLWEVRWLTPARAVLRIKLAPGCQFDEVHGVGQEAALKPPGGAR